MDSFLKQRFNAAKCKTLLKLSIPRIKLLRNRREVQLKQMRRDIAKLLATGQEATARIRVEHIIREEKMMAAQEIVELFSELIAVRLPIIEAQKECPLDLKEAISTLCFAAPRCADLPELLQIQMLFATKYGKEFVSAATELLPECGVNRQVVELLSIRAPAPDVKLKLLKDIAEEHELDWDPSASEGELLKSHEDLLSGPTQYVSAPKLPFPSEKLEEETTPSEPATQERLYSDEDSDIIDFPEVPTQPLVSNRGTAAAPDTPLFPASDGNDQEPNLSRGDEILSPSKVTLDKQFLPFLSPPSHSPSSFPVKEQDSTPATPKPKNQKVDIQEVLAAARAAAETAERAARSCEVNGQEPPNPSRGDQILSASKVSENREFLPFISPSSQSSTVEEQNSSPCIPKWRNDKVDLQEVIAAAHAAAETAERAAAAARSAANIAQLRISELVNRSNDGVSSKD